MKFRSLEYLKQRAKDGQPTAEPICKQWMPIEKAIDAEQRTVTFTISTGDVDRQGDTISPDGWQVQSYLMNPVVLWQHENEDLPIGRTLRLWVESGKIKAEIQFTPAELNPIGDTVFRLIQAGFLQAVSVGFLPLAWTWANRNGEDDDEEDRPEWAWDITEQELLEISIVTVPANPSALADGKSKGLDSITLARWRNLAGDAIQPTPVLDQHPNELLTTKANGFPCNRAKAAIRLARARLSDIGDTVMLQKLKQARAKTLDAMDAMITGAVDESGEVRDLTDEEKAQYATMEAQLAGHDEQIKRAHALDRSRAAGAVPSATFRGEFGAEPKRAVPVAEKFSRMVRCLAAERGNFRAAAQLALDTWQDDEMASSLAMGKAMAAGDFTSGGALIPPGWSNEIIELLRPASVVRQLGAMTVPMPNGQITMPRIITGSSFAYVGENNNIATTELTVGQVTMTARKLAGVIPISNDLIRYPSPAADALIIRDMQAGAQQAEDATFIRGAGTSNTPKGLRYQAPTASVLTMTATPDIAKITADLARLETLLLNANIPGTRLGWILAPRVMNYLRSLRDATTSAYAFPEMQTGLLRGVPFRATTAVPINLGGGTASEVYLADFSEVMIGETGSIAIDVSTDAAYYDGSAVVSAFSKDQTVIRLIMANDLAIRHLEAVAVLDGVTWGA